jgi:hypothetical protein
MPNMLNGDLMRRLRPSTTCTGLITSWKFTPMVDIHTSDQLLQSTQDGGKCSDLKVNTSRASIKRNILMFKELLIPKEDISNVTRRRLERSINNGM